MESKYKNDQLKLHKEKSILKEIKKGEDLTHSRSTPVTPARVDSSFLQINQNQWEIQAAREILHADQQGALQHLQGL